MFARKATGLIVLLAAFCQGFSATRAKAADEGIAIAILYDTSGSMNESVPAGNGGSAPKYIIANKALASIVDLISQFATNTAGGPPRKIDAGLYVFRGATAGEAVKFGPFDATAMKNWVGRFSQPAGATPLGMSIQAASRALLNSSLPHKHLVIITDGMNTSGPPPERVIPGIKSNADKHGTAISFHFVAFDVDAKVFDPVKKLGATVLAASNERQLNEQLSYIFQKKILLEEEETAPAAAGKPK